MNALLQEAEFLLVRIIAVEGSATMSPKSTIIFDTSAVNALADHPQVAALLRGLTEGFLVRITAINGMEICATTDVARRQELFRVCSRLAYSGECIREHNWIITNLIATYRGNQSVFQWKSLNIRYPELENALPRQEEFTDQLSEDQREDSRSRHSNFDRELSRARSRVEALFAKNPDSRPASFGEFAASVQRPDGAFWFFAGILFRRNNASLQADEAALRGFIEACPPFRALVFAHCLGQYQRAIKDPRQGPSYDAGAFDLYTAVYLPYCDVFVTNDLGQRNAMEEIAVQAKIPVQVRSWKELCVGLLPGFVEP